MASTIKVEVKAIYEDTAAPSGARVTQRDSDVTLATNAAAGATHYTPGGQPVPSDQEYITKFGVGAPAPSALDRYGTLGWVATQWLLVRQDGDSIGLAIANRLATRSLKPGSKVQVFPVDRDAGPYVTGAVTFQQSWPAAPTDTH